MTTTMMMLATLSPASGLEGGCGAPEAPLGTLQCNCTVLPTLQHAVAAGLEARGHSGRARHLFRALHVATAAATVPALSCGRYPHERCRWRWDWHWRWHWDWHWRWRWNWVWHWHWYCHCHWHWCCSGWAGHGHQLGLHKFEGQACAATTHRFVAVRGSSLGQGCGVGLAG